MANSCLQALLTESRADADALVLWTASQPAAALWALSGPRDGPPPWPRRVDDFKVVARALQALPRSRDLGCGGVHVVVVASGIDANVALTWEHVWTVLLPLASWICDMRQQQPRRRCVVGVVGGAGSGKTVASVLLSMIVRLLFQARAVADDVTTVSMDGYHFTNAHLDAHTTVDAAGATVPLRTFKGRIDTMDVETFISDLTRLHDADDAPAGAAVADVWVSEYDRVLHDPVPRARAVQPQHGVVIVEGLFLLGVPSIPGVSDAVLRRWDDVSPLLTASVFLDVADDLCKDRVVQRKVACGRDAADAAAYFDRVDVVTWRALSSRRRCASVCVGLSSSGGVDSPVVTSVSRSCATPLRAWSSRVARDSAAARMLVVGLNPALQKTMVFRRVGEQSSGAAVQPAWQRGEVNRAAEVAVSVGGKGQHCAIAASRVLPSGAVALLQFLGGDTGAIVARHLDALPLRQLTAAVPAATRTCTTLLDTSVHDMTELIEPSAAIAPAAVEQLLQYVDAECAATATVDAAPLGVAVMGTFPSGCDGVYAEVLRRVASTRASGRCTVLLDAYRGVDDLLASGAVHVLKVNVEELCALVGVPQPEGDDEHRRRGVVAVARQLLLRRAVSWLAITDGPRGGVLLGSATDGAAGAGTSTSTSTGTGTARSDSDAAAVLPAHDAQRDHWEVVLPPLPRPVVNPIGAGDVVSAVLLSLVLQGAHPSVAFAVGLAAGSASCMHLHGAHFDVDDVRALAAKVQLSLVRYPQ